MSRREATLGHVGWDRRGAPPRRSWTLTTQFGGKGGVFFLKGNNPGSKAWLHSSRQPPHSSSCDRHLLPVAWAWKREERASGRGGSLPGKSLPKLPSNSATLEAVGAACQGRWGLKKLQSYQE